MKPIACICLILGMSFCVSHHFCLRSRPPEPYAWASICIYYQECYLGQWYLIGKVIKILLNSYMGGQKDLEVLATVVHASLVRPDVA